MLEQLDKVPSWRNLKNKNNIRTQGRLCKYFKEVYFLQSYLSVAHSDIKNKYIITLVMGSSLIIGVVEGFGGVGFIKN